MTLRVLIGPFEVAGFGGSLASALCEQGARAALVELAANPFEFSGPRVHWASARILRRLRAARAGTGSVLARLCLLLLELPFRLWCLLRALFGYDAFVWLFGQSLLPAGLDMPLLRLLGKRQVCVFLGSDARPPYLSGLYVSRSPSPREMRRVARLTARMRQHVGWCEIWCDQVVNHPLTGQFHRRSYLDFASLGFPPPGGLRAAAPFRGSRDDGTLRVVHAPSRPEQKGTAEVRAAIAELQTGGMPIEYRELIGIDNATLLAEIATSDLVVDELWSDTPLGGLGRESALLGVPCLVCGYGSEALARVPGFSELPADCLVDPAAFRPTLRALLSDAGARARLATVQTEFVRTRWSALAVGARYAQLLQGRADPAWQVPAGGVRYLEGWGMPRDDLRAFLSAYLRERGAGALGLGHDPVLRDMIRTFAGIAPSSACSDPGAVAQQVQHPHAEHPGDESRREHR